VPDNQSKILCSFQVKIGGVLTRSIKVRASPRSKMGLENNQDRLSLPRGTLRWEAMRVLWSETEQTTWEIVEQLERRLGLRLHYTTVASVLVGLQEMGLVRRIKVQRRGFSYVALVLPHEFIQRAMKEAVGNLFRTCTPTQALSELVEIIADIDLGLLEKLEHEIATAKARSGTRKRVSLSQR
jgi:predicted transcriptional regulator